MPAGFPTLISPSGNRLVDLLVPEEELSEQLSAAQRLPSLTLSERSLCDLELLSTGAFSPLDRFMGRADFESVLRGMRLGNGLLFPIPVVLPVEPGPAVHLDRKVALRDPRGDILAIQTIEEAWEWSLPELARSVLGTEDVHHPLVAEMHSWGRVLVSGRLEVLRLPTHRDFVDLRLTPAAVRSRLSALGRTNVVAFQTRNPLHRAHEEMTKRAQAALDAALLLHPVVGLTKPGDVDHYTRVRTYKALVDRYYDPDRTVLALLPLAMWMAGPREAVWHAVIRRNFGANHLIIGRDHASAGYDSAGRPFHGPYDAQELVARHQEELGVSPFPFEDLVFLSDENRYEEKGKVPPGAKIVSLSGTVAREHLNEGRPLPEWFTRPEVAAILAEAHPARDRRGVCVWLTGLPAAGKSSIAEALTGLLLERGRRVTLLDGDVVRTHLSKGLGFSKADRDTNILRIGFVASEVVRHGGIAICAAVSPYRAVRAEVRALMGPGQMAEVHVATPLAVCEARDLKGLYAKARRGEATGVTGIDDPYEPPSTPELVFDATSETPGACAEAVLLWLVGHGFVRDAARDPAS